MPTILNVSLQIKFGFLKTSLTLAKEYSLW